MGSQFGAPLWARCNREATARLLADENCSARIDKNAVNPEICVVHPGKSTLNISSQHALLRCALNRTVTSRRDSAILQLLPSSRHLQGCLVQTSFIMTKRALSVLRLGASGPSQAKKACSVPRRAAAQRASSAVQDEARHVETFDVAEGGPKKRAGGARKKTAQTSSRPPCA